MIDISGLTKIYADKKVVDSLTLEIPKGEIFGLLGPNGAGKSTAIRMLCSIIKADEGKAKIAGFDLFTGQLEIKKRIGYMSQNFGLYEELTVLENIRFYASLYGKYDENRINELLKTYQIDQYANYQAGKLSGGYKQRLSLACALMYFLDEDSENVIIAPEPFIKTTEVLFNPDEKETWFFLPGVIGVLLMQVALILAGTAIVREKEKYTLEQIIVSPVSKTEFIIGKITPYLLISFFEFYFILTIGWLIFDIPIPPTSHVYLFLLALVYVGAMISLGLLISMISQTQQQAMFLAIFVIIPSMLLSGLIFPIEAMPSFLQPVAYIFPFTYFIEIIRGVLIKETLFADLAVDYLALLGFTIFFVILSIAKFRKYLS